MKRKKAALYDPFLDTVGGGEKHILSILKVLEGEGFAVDIFWDTDLSAEIGKRFDLRFDSLTFRPNIFKKASGLAKYKTLSEYEYFFYMTDGSYFFSTARNNIVFAMVPKHTLYRHTTLNSLKLHNYRFISNSLFTQKNLQAWGISSVVIYPYIDEAFMTNSKVPKEPYILSVGRFFGQLHSKKHHEIINAFLQLKKRKEFARFKLIMAGGVMEQDSEYFATVEKAAKQDPAIVLKPNIDHSELVNLYKKSLFYWHFTGYDEDENQHPERVEHLGITPLEAMSSGCITACYKAGGPREIIQDGMNGYLFENTDELFKKMSTAMEKGTQSKISKNAMLYVRKNFSYDAFRKRVLEVLVQR